MQPNDELLKFLKIEDFNKFSDRFKNELWEYYLETIAKPTGYN